MQIFTFNNGNPELESYLSWWIAATQREPHMVSLDESFRVDLLHAVIAIEDGRPIGAAAIVPARTALHEPIQFGPKMVVELGSNFVEPDFRRNGLARAFVEERIRVSREYNWFPVSVTTNPAVQSLFRNIGGKPIDEEDLLEFQDLKKKLCMCQNGPGQCNFCPFTKNAAWYFP